MKVRILNARTELGLAEATEFKKRVENQEIKEKLSLKTKMIDQLNSMKQTC